MPHAAIGIDVIVGFPGEGEEEFAQTVAFLDDLPAAYFHVFTYSERAKTTALRLEDVVPFPVRKARNKVLRQMSLKKQWAHAARFEGYGPFALCCWKLRPMSSACRLGLHPGICAGRHLSSVTAVVPAGSIVPVKLCPQCPKVAVQGALAGGAATLTPNRIRTPSVPQLSIFSIAGSLLGCGGSCLEAGQLVWTDGRPGLCGGECALLKRELQKRKELEGLSLEAIRT